MSGDWTPARCIELIKARATELNAFRESVTPEEEMLNGVAAMVSVICEMADDGISTRIIGRMIKLNRDAVRELLHSARLERDQA